MIKKLQKIATISTLHQSIIDYVLMNDGETAIQMLKEVVAYGCGTGVMTFLIRSKDIKAFFIKHSIEIIQIAGKTVKSTDITPYCYCAVETIANDILCRLQEGEENG